MGVRVLVYMWFVALEKAYNCVPCGIVVDTVGVLGTGSSATNDPVALFNQSCVCILSTKSDKFSVSDGLRQGELRWFGNLIRMPPGRA